MLELAFARPVWLLALPLAPAAAWWAMRRLGSGERWRAACDPALLAHLMTGTRQGAARLAPTVLGLGLALACLALAGPTLPREDQPLFRSTAARVVVLDLSRSMNAADLSPSRAARARYKVADILRRTRDGQAGLVVFAGDAFVISPLTDDARTLLAMLPALDSEVMPVPGSRLSSALELAGELIGGAGLARAEVIVVADGADGDAAAAATALHEAGTRVSVLGVGTVQGAPVPGRQRGFLNDAEGRLVVARLGEEALAAVARAGGGRYARIRPDDADIDHLLDSSPGTGASAGDVAGERRTLLEQDHGAWLIAALLPLAALAFRRGWLLCVLLLLQPPAPALAFDWESLWLRRDQRSARALERGEFDRAAELAPDPWRRGAARYRGGEYAAAADEFAEGLSATDHYNRANALARSGALRDAIGAYDEALDLRPGDEDARFNRDLVERLLRDAARQGGGGGEDGDGSSATDAPRGERDDGAREGAAGEESAGATARRDDGRGEAGGEAPAQSGRQQEADGSEPDDEVGSPRRHGREAAVAGQDAQASEASGEEGRGAAAREGATEAQRRRLEQMLERVPDDPGGLLRRKFALQFRERGGRVPAGVDPW